MTDSSANKKIILIGAGPAGLSCAYQLVKQGHAVEIFEASPHVGGMSRSMDLWGQRVDLGPHRFFSNQKRINDFFAEVIQDDFTLVERQTRIYYNKRYFNYPLKLTNVLRNLSIPSMFQILWHYGLQRLSPIKDPQNFEEWVTNRFGKKLYELFFKHYTEKLWGIPCTQIDADWAAQRIKKLSLFEAVKSAIVGNRNNQHKTLVEQFAYPKNGTGSLYEKTAQFIENNGGKVHYQSPIKRVILDDAQKRAIGVELLDGSIQKADAIVSTMPLTLLLKGFEQVPQPVQKASEQLYFRNTILVYLEIDQQDLFPDNWLYIHSPNVRHGRITNFRNWCPSLTKGQSSTILCLEYWCFNEDAIWKEDEANLIALAKEEIYQVDLVPKEAKVLNATTFKLPRCYPVYETGYQVPIAEIVGYLNTIENLYPIGRYGAFKYNNQDHSILMGLLAADKINDNSAIDLWKINTDTEYQEEALQDMVKD